MMIDMTETRKRTFHLNFVYFIWESLPVIFQLSLPFIVQLYVFNPNKNANPPWIVFTLVKIKDLLIAAWFFWLPSLGI